jgi:hypothetical protein
VEQGATIVDDRVQPIGRTVAARQVLGPQAAAIAGPAGGATVDSEVRAVVDQILATLRLHGLIAV